ncbi:hypothetical protein [Phenylobacterium sp.]|uniref:hypothetical protein n=1 Tax=Phenylobacterium sp. TaxID=1871053 RepID=UPI0030F3988B
MPQPLRKKCHLTFKGLEDRPDHARVIGQIVAISGRIESRLGSLLAIMTGGLTHVTIPMFLAVRSADAQRSMLQAAAQHALGPDDLERFTAIMDDWRGRYGERNKIVHNIWGHSDDHPKLAIRIAAEDFAEIWKTSAFLTNPEVAERAAITLRDLWKSCEGWTVKDLEDVKTRLEGYETRISRLWADLYDRQFPRVAPTMTGQASRLDRGSGE